MDGAKQCEGSEAISNLTEESGVSYTVKGSSIPARNRLKGVCQILLMFPLSQELLVLG